MVFEVKTEPYGRVEFGFHPPFINFVQVDNRVFMTKRFCGLAEEFAKNPGAQYGQIWGYGLDTFRTLDEHYRGLHNAAFAASFMKKSDQESMRERMRKITTEVPIEYEVNLRDDGTLIPVKIIANGSSVVIGDRRFSDYVYGKMIDSVTRDGRSWLAGHAPNYAKGTVEAIRMSDNPIFRRIRGKF